VVDSGVLADRFEAERPHLRAVAYRMLGSLAEAEDAVQEAWLKLSRSDVSAVQNLGGWLTTVVGRVCLDVLRARASRREDSLEDRLPDPVVTGPEGQDPEAQALLADSVGLALMVVLDSLGPAERLAFVLHDSFAVPFEDVAQVLGRSTAATKQLAHRARRRVQDAAPPPDPDPSRRRRVVEAFLAASREGDFDGLLTVLAPDVTLSADRGAALGGLSRLRGAAAVAGQALAFARFAYSSEPVLVNGVPGVVSVAGGRPVSLMSFTISDGVIVAIDILADPDRLPGLVRSAR
jgi:RNA polymerase sigma factor (sigma-70 family)